MLKICIFLVVGCATISVLPTNLVPVIESYPPQPFAYQYGVKDDLSGNFFDKTESQDEQGSVRGQYKINLPDGRVQVVTYFADREHGFVADVSYEGIAVYPPEPAGGYGSEKKLSKRSL